VIKWSSGQGIWCTTVNGLETKRRREAGTFPAGMTEKKHRGQVCNGHVCMPPYPKNQEGANCGNGSGRHHRTSAFFRRNRVTGAFDLEYADAITA
jgi:hypothetical protein